MTPCPSKPQDNAVKTVMSVDKPPLIQPNMPKFQAIHYPGRVGLLPWPPHPDNTLPSSTGLTHTATGSFCPTTTHPPDRRPPPPQRNTNYGLTSLSPVHTPVRVAGESLDIVALRMGSMRCSTRSPILRTSSPRQRAAPARRSSPAGMGGTRCVGVGGGRSRFCAGCTQNVSRQVEPPVACLNAWCGWMT
jgi:hypothetical protein